MLWRKAKILDIIIREQRCIKDAKKSYDSTDTLFYNQLEKKDHISNQNLGIETACDSNVLSTVSLDALVTS